MTDAMPRYRPLERPRVRWAKARLRWPGGPADFELQSVSVEEGYPVAPLPGWMWIQGMVTSSPHPASCGWVFGFMARLVDDGKASGEVVFELLPYGDGKV